MESAPLTNSCARISASQFLDVSVPLPAYQVTALELAVWLVREHRLDAGTEKLKSQATIPAVVVDGRLFTGDSHAAAVDKAYQSYPNANSAEVAESAGYATPDGFFFALAEISG